MSDQAMNWGSGDPGKVGIDFDMTSDKSISFTLRECTGD